ncbi:DUF7226 domain-containing protein [Empedobacter sp. UBA4754]|uniref:DUF7226 domain-containing protein n=1 Tax=Empedobacter sp. UBA4754 TaxID=1946437 RepID=UPI003BB86298
MISRHFLYSDIVCYIKVINNKILEHKPFNIIFEYFISHSQNLIIIIRIELLKDCNLYKVDSFETLGRRSSTIIRWIDWILTQNEDYNIIKKRYSKMSISFL